MDPLEEAGISESVRQRAARVRLVVFDVDGTLTDGRLILGEGGTELKVFDSKDGQGLVMLRASGVHVAIITGRESLVVAERMAALGIPYVYQGCAEKRQVFDELIAQLGLLPEQTAYVGDDIGDLPVLRRAGLAIAVADAHPLLRQHVHWVTTRRGGRGAAREVCDLILDQQGLLNDQLAPYLADD